MLKDNEYVDIKRDHLEYVSLYMDTNNPKPELNGLYVDNDMVCSTNTRALAVFNHGKKLKKNTKIFIESSIVKDALKKKDAVEFRLSAFTIGCLNDDGELFLELKCFTKNLHKYPDIKRINLNIDNEGVFGKDKFIFTDLHQIAGILAVNMIDVDNKWIPRIRSPKYRRSTGGVIYIQKHDHLPIMIRYENEVVTMLMPIIDTFKMFREKIGE